MNPHWLSLLMAVSIAFAESACADTVPAPRAAPPAANLRLTNVTDILNLTPQNVQFHGADNCDYFGNTAHYDHAGGVSVTRRVCPNDITIIKARAYIIELKIPGTPTPLIPADNVWILKQEASPSG